MRKIPLKSQFFLKDVYLCDLYIVELAHWIVCMVHIASFACVINPILDRIQKLGLKPLILCRGFIHRYNFNNLFILHWNPISW